MAADLRDGERRPFELGNRGPISFNSDGSLAGEILDTYWRCGFYVFTGVLSLAELEDLEDDVADIWARVPSSKGATTDTRGRPALGADWKAPTVQWARLLSDPLGALARPMDDTPRR